MEKQYKQEIDQNQNKRPTILRKLQTVHHDRCFLLVVPKNLISQLRIAKGDYIKYSLSDSNKLVLERADV